MVVVQPAEDQEFVSGSNHAQVEDVTTEQAEEEEEGSRVAEEEAGPAVLGPKVTTVSRPGARPEIGTVVPF